MALQLRQTLKQTQKLVLTQELKLGIELLNLTNLELADRIQRELENNPLLEISESNPPPEEDYYSASQESKMAREKLGKTTDQELRARLENGEDPRSENRERERERDWESGRDSWEAADRKQSFLEGAVAQRESLKDHLRWQLRFADLSDTSRDIADFLISDLDHHGYLPPNAGEYLSDMVDRGDLPAFREEELEAAIAWLQQCDPAGLGARDLKECLRLQARYYKPEDSLLEQMLRDSFELLEKLEYEKIARGLGVSLEEVMERARFISSLDPHPGQGWGPDSRDYIQPDVAVLPREKTGQFFIQILDSRIPSLEINDYYSGLIAGRRRAQKREADENAENTDSPRTGESPEEKAAKTMEDAPPVDPETTQYIQNHLGSAQALIRSITYRRDTLLKVVTAIAELQREWFESGRAEDLQPMTLRHISDLTEMSESAVSRLTSRKHVQTPWGTFSLKYFFSSAVKGKSGKMDSSKKIMSRIEALIGAEDPAHPLSDSAMVELLNKEGIQAARRTVAKYRGLLGIPNHTRRRKIDKLREKLPDK